MTELLVSVFLATAAVGVCTQLLHPRGRGGVSGFAFGVLLASVIVSAVPRLPELDFKPEELIPEQGQTGDYYYAARDAVCYGVCEAVCGKMGFSAEDVSVELINFDFENMRCDTVVVTLRGAAALGDRVGVEKFVNDMEIGRCRVDVSIG